MKILTGPKYPWEDKRITCRKCLAVMILEKSDTPTDSYPDPEGTPQFEVNCPHCKTALIFTL